MRSTFGFLVAAAAALSVVSGVVRAEAQAAAVRVGLRYDVPAECPGRAELVRQVGLRTERLTLVEGDEAQLSVRAEGQLFVGVLRSARGATPREVRAERCDEMIQALALVLALAYDPEARSEALSARVEDAGPNVAEPTDAAAPALRPVVDAGVAPAVTTSKAAPEPPFVARFRIGVGAGAEISNISFPTFGARVFGTVSRDEPGMLAFAARLAASRTVAISRGSADGTGSVSFVWSDVEVEACPLKAPGMVLLARLCALGALSITEAAPQGRANVTDKLRVGASTGVSLPLSWFPWDGLGFELRPSLVVPFRRDRFYFEPDATTFSTPIAFFRLGFGVIGRFP